MQSYGPPYFMVLKQDYFFSICTYSIHAFFLWTRKILNLFVLFCFVFCFVFLFCFLCFFFAYLDIPPVTTPTGFLHLYHHMPANFIPLSLCIEILSTWELTICEQPILCHHMTSFNPPWISILLLYIMSQFQTHVIHVSLQMSYKGPFTNTCKGGGLMQKGGPWKFWRPEKGALKKKTLILPLKSESIWFSVGLMPIFLGKKGGPEKL